jgi:hypothetical protein
MHYLDTVVALGKMVTHGRALIRGAIIHQYDLDIKQSLFS